jgi:hypothetical protein
MGVSECSVGVPPAKSGSFGHKTIVLHRRDARATLFCKCLLLFLIPRSSFIVPRRCLNLRESSLSRTGRKLWTVECALSQVIEKLVVIVVTQVPIFGHDSCFRYE